VAGLEVDFFGGLGLGCPRCLTSGLTVSRGQPMGRKKQACAKKISQRSTTREIEINMIVTAAEVSGVGFPAAQAAKRKRVDQ